ncbi:MAG: hypothetical protein M1813_008013 [Trichoglossum hirsutum]|nr:MAG: hypothetical protein M1813_008013 [Trichoglossum hirsutum]
MYPPTLRYATILDLPRLLEILLDALPDDPFYNYLWKYRDDYPNDHKGYWLQRLQADIYNPSYSFMVMEVTAEDRNPVAAFGIWERRGEDTGAHERRSRGEEGWRGVAWEFHRRSLKELVSGSPRRDAPPDRLAECTGVLADVTAHFDASYPSRFQLELICTHREYQRHGFGSAIVSWGLGEAARDGVPVSVAASPLGERLYQKMGFKWDREWVVGVPGEEEEVSFRTWVWTG